MLDCDNIQYSMRRCVRIAQSIIIDKRLYCATKNYAKTNWKFASKHCRSQMACNTALKRRERKKNAFRTLRLLCRRGVSIKTASTETRKEIYISYISPNGYILYKIFTPSFSAILCICRFSALIHFYGAHNNRGGVKKREPFWHSSL